MSPPNNKQGKESMAIKEPLTEQFYIQVSDSIKLIFDLTSRIDERVKMLAERQTDVQDRLDKILDVQQQLSHRVAILETKDVSSVKAEVSELGKKVAIIETQDEEIREMKETIHGLKNKIQTLELKSEALQIKNAGHDREWSVIFDFVFKMGFMILGGYILYKMGIQSPPTP